MSLIENLEEAIRQDERELMKRRIVAAIDGDDSALKSPPKVEAQPAAPRKRQRRQSRTERQERQVTNDQIEAVAMALATMEHLHKDGSKPSAISDYCQPRLTRKTVGAAARVLVAAGRAIVKRGRYQLVESAPEDVEPVVSEPDGIDHEAEGGEAAQ